jgi:hypothetical protein
MEREPSQQESPKQELIAGLRRLKTDYKDSIPTEIKHSSSPDGKWKVQRGVWFQAVSIEFCKVIERQLGGETLIPKELFDRLLTYWHNLTSADNPLKHRLTQQSDIDEAEAMIDEVIEELEK